MDPNVNPPVKEQAPLEVIPPAQQQIEQKTAFGKKKILIIGIIVLFLTLMAGGGLLLFVGNNAKKTPNNPSNTTMTATPSPKTAESINELIALKANEKTKVPGLEIYLTYIESNNPSEECFDCIASTAVIIENGIETQEHEYTCGGIAGDCVNSFEEFGYVVELVQKIDSQTIQVLIKNK